MLLPVHHNHFQKQTIHWKVGWNTELDNKESSLAAARHIEINSWEPANPYLSALIVAILFPVSKNK